MRVFAVILLLLVGVVFVAAPAGLLAKLTPDYMDQMFWVAVIFAYYFLATILPIDKIIGRLYPPVRRRADHHGRGHDRDHVHQRLRVLQLGLLPQ